MNNNMMKENRSASLFPKELVIESLKQSFVKLDPRTMFRNPIMFIVEVVTFVMLVVTVWSAAGGDTAQGSFGYNILVFIVLFLTLLFANLPKRLPRHVVRHKPTVCARHAKRHLRNGWKLVEKLRR